MTRDFELTVKYDGFKRALRAIGETELPEAIAAGINRIAGGAAAAQLMNVRHDFILRNKYTERSLAFYRANPKKDINRINAIVGSKQPYMALQEEGGERRPVKGIAGARADEGRTRRELARSCATEVQPEARTADLEVLHPPARHHGSEAARILSTAISRDVPP